MDKSLYDGVYYDDGELLPKLYTLRAGLSLVAQEREAVNKIVDEAKAKRNDYFSKVGAYLKTVKLKVDDAEAEYNSAVEAERENKELAGTKLNKSLLPLFAVMLAIGVLAVTYCIFYFVYNYSIYPQKGDVAFFNSIYGWAVAPKEGQRCNWEFFILIGISLISVILFIFSLLRVISRLRYYWDDIMENRAKRAARRRRRKFAGQTSFKKNLFDEQKAQYDKIAEEYKIKCNKAVLALNAEVEVRSAPHIALAQMLIRALNATYGRMLNYRNWADLDIVIFALEANRADTIKEAMRFVDEERRMRGVMNAVSGAVQSLAFTLNTQFGRIASELHKGFGQLSQQIDRQSKIIAAEFEQMNETIQNRAKQSASEFNAIFSELQAINGSIESQTNVLSYKIAANTAATFLVTEAQVQTALRRYGNKSSENLMKDLDAISKGMTDIQKSFTDDSFHYRYLTGINYY